MKGTDENTVGIYIMIEKVEKKIERCQDNGSGWEITFSGWLEIKRCQNKQNCTGFTKILPGQVK